MSAKERLRLEAMGRVKRREISVVQAAELMSVSLRQTRRLWKRFKESQDQGLIHKLRGRTSNHRFPEELRDRVVRRHQASFACEKLAEEGLILSPDTLVAILKKERHLYRPMRHRKKHRRRRERRKHFGSMVQIDGSHHNWFEGCLANGQWCVLMVMVDDATGHTWARFYAAETTEAAFDIFGRWVRQHGVPRSVYSDRHGIYRDEDHPEKPTQFGRAMKELNVELILAKSPQAKGRVERKHRVFQDRLVKELRLRGISGLEQANTLLEKILLPAFNRRYAIKAEREADLHREASGGIEEILCVQELRVVGNDWCVRWCVRWKNRWLQIQQQAESAGLAGKQVKVRQLGSGKLVVEQAGKKLAFEELAGRPKQPVRARQALPQVNNRRYRPGPDHPYNREVRASMRSRARAAAPPQQRPLHA